MYIIADNCSTDRSVDAALLLSLLGFYNRKLILAIQDILEEAHDAIRLVMDIMVCMNCIVLEK